MQVITPPYQYHARTSLFQPHRLETWLKAFVVILTLTARIYYYSILYLMKFYRQIVVPLDTAIHRLSHTCHIISKH